MYFSGLMGCPLYQSSKCRCGPVLSVPLIAHQSNGFAAFHTFALFLQQGTTMFVKSKSNPDYAVHLSDSLFRRYKCLRMTVPSIVANALSLGLAAISVPKCFFSALKWSETIPRVGRYKI